MSDPNVVALANLLWDNNWEWASWADCYKSAEATVADREIKDPTYRAAVARWEQNRRMSE